MKRRKFLKATLAATSAGLAPFNILRAGVSPNSKLNIAVIGVGRQGASNARALQQTDTIVALCDVHESECMAQLAKHEPLQGIKLWQDYRVMFDKIGKEIDAVCIATPEHNHYTIAVHAMRRGKHVYCQKPLCHTVNEVRLLTEEAKKHTVVTQMGNQGHSSPSSANIKDWVNAGAVGPIREVIAYSRKNYWVEKPIIPGGQSPADLDWNLYLNRAEAIPFSPSYLNREWIKYNHFSGAVGDMGAHTLDPGYYALDLKIPLSVRADVPVPALPWSLPRAGVITWKFGARGSMPPVTMKYYLGPEIDFPFPQHLEKERPPITAGTVLIGEGASIMAGSHSNSARIIPEVRMKEIGKAPETAFRCKGGSHFKNFTLACKGEDTAMSSFDYAGPLSELIVLGDIALMHPNRELLWDAGAMRITNDDEANRSLFMRRLDPRDDLGWT